MRPLFLFAMLDGVKRSPALPQNTIAPPPGRVTCVSPVTTLWLTVWPAASNTTKPVPSGIWMVMVLPSRLSGRLYQRL